MSRKRQGCLGELARTRGANDFTSQQATPPSNDRVSEDEILRHCEQVGDRVGRAGARRGHQRRAFLLRVSS